MSSLLCNYPNNCLFQYYIFQFQKTHFFIFPSFSPCLFLCFIKDIDIRGLRSSSVNSIISVISEATLNDCFWDTCTPMFIAELFTIARTWKQPRCPSADEWIRKLCYISTMEYYSAIKKNSFESVLMRWMNLEPIIQSEVSQKEKHQYSILTHIYGI